MLGTQNQLVTVYSWSIWENNMSQDYVSEFKKEDGTYLTVMWELGPYGMPKTIKWEV